MPNKTIEEFNKRFPVPDGMCQECELAMRYCDYCLKEREEMKSFLQEVYEAGYKEGLLQSPTKKWTEKVKSNLYKWLDEELDNITPHQ